MIGARDLARWSLSGIREGARLSLPLLPGTVVFAAAFGALAAQKGLSLFEATLMSALVFAGASQLVAMEVWTSRWSFGAVLTLALVTATVNMRFMLMGASLRPWFGALSPWQSYPVLLLTVDANWLIAMSPRGSRASHLEVFVGSGLALWAFWVAATVPGYLLGALLSEPKRFGLDFILPAFFAALLIPLWRGPRRAFAWLIAGGTALAIAQLTPGWWFIIGGALAGSVAGGWLDERS